jgi:hypothetical protein
MLPVVEGAAATALLERRLISCGSSEVQSASKPARASSKLSATPE